MITRTTRRVQLFLLIAVFGIIFYYAAFYGLYYDPTAPFSLFNPVLKRQIRPDLEGYLNKHDFIYVHNGTKIIDPIIILTWTKVFGNDWRRELIDRCDRRCVITSDRRYLNRSAAVMYHPRDLVHTDLPTVKYLNQKYVFYNEESPVLTFAALRGASSTFFDWTITYRTDSTIYCPFAYFERLPHGESNSIIDLRRKSKMVLWVASNCDTHSKRERYVHELRKYIQVDTFGDCGQTCYKNDTFDCAKQLAEEYRFYISFENAVCRDYISEKFGHRLNEGLVPIVLRGEDYDRLIPYKRHFRSPENHNQSRYIFIAADNYSNPKELADYLIHLASHPKEYAKYFDWRQYWKIVYTGNSNYCYCRLCRKLHGEREHWRWSASKSGSLVRSDIMKVEDGRRFDIYQWWNVDACDRGMALKMLDSGWRRIQES